eukprot:4443320-Pyramimonas_sp.AAC.1
MAFLGVIHSAAYSGLETYILGKRDYDRLDKVILGFAKVVLRGVATRRGDGEREQVRTPKAWMLRKRLHLGDERTELLGRRIRYWQNLALHPEASARVTAAQFGHFSALQERPVFLEDDWIHP